MKLIKKLTTILFAFMMVLAMTGVVLADDKESIVLSQIRQNPKITTKQISINTGIPFRTVQRHIANLRDKNIIVRKGSNRDGYWNITKGI